jgi:hypothetical protein
MRKIVLILALVGAALAAAGQALPSGSVLFGQNTWLAPDGSVWTGKDGYGYKKLLGPDDLTPYLNKTTATTQFVTPNVVFNGDVTLNEAPTAAAHAINRGFLDAKLQPYFHKDTSAVQFIYSPTTFDNGTQVWVQRTPTNDNDVANKKYVDDAIAEIDIGGTDLGITGTTGARTITSSTGTGAVIPAANGAVSGVMTPTHVNQLVTAYGHTLQSVTNNGKVTNNGIVITGGGISANSNSLQIFKNTNNVGQIGYFYPSGGGVAQGAFFSLQADTAILGIGNAASSMKIYIDGGPKLDFLGDVTAAEFYRTSTRKIKKDIAPFSENATSILNGVDVVEYKLKKGPDYKKIGFIAEDTHEYLATPEHNVMDQGSTIGLLIKAVQELSAKVEELERRLAECQE